MQTNIAVRALGLGASSGLRTMAAPTAMFAGEGKPLVLLPALAELTIDKLPSTPSRTRPFGLLARAVAAALACAALAQRTDEDAMVLVPLGITGALVAAYIGA